MKFTRVWQIVYPILLYYLCYNLIYAVLVFLFGAVCSRLFCLGVASLLTLPVMVNQYRRLPIVREQHGLHMDKLPMELLGIAAVVIWGVVLNILLTHTAFVESSASYAQANATLYSGGFVTKVFANCITIPVLEELVYRGIVCKQLDQWLGRLPAVVISALVFGMMHWNPVQFLYGFLVGLLLGLVYRKTDRLWVVMVAHGLTNFAALLGAAYL
jgi:membrane protease YdiL (CAAX protease family)